MIIILSKSLTNSLKEKIVNATYEASRVMPVLLDYMKPIRDLSREATLGPIKYVKIPGDDIVKINEEVSKKLIGALESAVGLGSLSNYLVRRKEFEETDIETTKIINNFQENDETIFLEYLQSVSRDKIICMGNKGDKVISGAESIELKSESYEDIAIEIQEKLGAVGFTEKTLDEIAMEKLNELTNTKEKEIVPVYRISTKKETKEETPTPAETTRVFTKEDIERLPGPASTPHDIYDAMTVSGI